MLNYLATESRVIISSKNNRLALEDIYNMLINNTNPSIVDETTQYYMEIMLDDIEKFRMIGLQRERLQYFLENSQAQAITKAMPNPLYLLGNLGTLVGAGATSAGASGAGALGSAGASGAGALGGILIAKTIATVSLMTLDSVMQYQSAKNEGQIQFLKDNWELDDNESTTLHNLRKRTFSYMIDIARVNSLKASDTLNEESIDNFVSFALDDNLQRKKQALESNRNIYFKYGAYWLELASTYYKLDLYKECIQAIKEYEAIQAPIFRKDFDYAKVLPFVIISASYVYEETEDYSAHVTYYLKKLIENTSESQWALRYFAAQNYIHLASISNKNENLLTAYNLLINNVRYLSHEQENLLEKYKSPIDEKIASGLTDVQEKQTKKMIKELKKQRKNELPPLHEGLITNYSVLFPLMKEINISTQQRNEINAIVNNAFISPILKYNYFNFPYEIDKVKISNRYNIIRKITLIFIDPLINLIKGKQSWKNISLELPVTYLSEDSNISLNIRANNRAYPMHNLPYAVTKVSRSKKSNIPEFIAKVRVSLSDVLVVEKKEEYELFIEISVVDNSCIMVFLSPIGKTNFIFDHVE
jgi:hypothetical protein